MDFYLKQFGAIVEQLPDGEPFDYVYGLYQNYFTVYESNVSFVGQIPDDDLRQAIVATYGKARALIDTHLHNNELVRRRDSLEAMRDQTGNSNLDAKISAASADLRSNGKAVKENYQEMKRRGCDLIARIDKFVSDRSQVTE